jgi:hypothetical protein
MNSTDLADSPSDSATPTPAAPVVPGAPGRPTAKLVVSTCVLSESK